MRQRISLMGFAAWDAASLYVSYNLTFLARIGRWEGLSLGFAVISATWLGMSYLIGRYSPDAEGIRRPWVGRIAKTWIAGSAVMAIFVGHSWAYQVVDAQTRFRGFLIPFVVGAALLSTAGQSMGPALTEKRRRWLIVCDEKERETVARELKTESVGIREQTLFGSSKTMREVVEDAGGPPTGYAVGSIGENNERITEKLLSLRETGERVIPLLGWCEQVLQRIPPELVSREWLIQAEGFSLRPGSFSWRLKRFGDVVGAAILIVITAPVLVLSGILVWLEDRGPILYHQVRSGLYGRPIRIWKLRSMRKDAEKAGARWATRNDPRITRIGRIIRSTRIDELPQLFSVLSGDLSLIGPRPERPEIEDELEKHIPNYRIRHWIRPGLSGWAQVCYPYGASTEDSRMKLSYDLYYLRNASILLDVLITIKTMRLVAGARGASPKQG